MIAIASDHAGFKLKEEIILKYNPIDYGTFDDSSCNYAIYARHVANHIKLNPSHFGILICGSGVGMSMVANRFAFLRAVLATNLEIAKLAREHNNANILCLGARFIDKETAFAIIDAFLNASFLGERHKIRIDSFKDLGTV